MRSEEDIFPASWARSEECGGKQMHLGKLCLRGETSLSQSKEEKGMFMEEIEGMRSSANPWLGVHLAQWKSQGGEGRVRNGVQLGTLERSVGDKDWC